MLTDMSPAILVNGGGQDYEDPRVMYTNLSRYLKVSIENITFAETMICTDTCEGRVYDRPRLCTHNYLDQNLHHFSLPSPVHCARLSTRFNGCRHRLLCLDGCGHSRWFSLLYSNAELLGPSYKEALLQLQCLVPGNGDYRTTFRCGDIVPSTQDDRKVASLNAEESCALGHISFGRLVSG